MDINRQVFVKGEKWVWPDKNQGTQRFVGNCFLSFQCCTVGQFFKSLATKEASLAMTQSSKSCKVLDRTNWPRRALLCLAPPRSRRPPRRRRVVPEYLDVECLAAGWRKRGRPPHLRTTQPAELVV